jgi:hypothetical protein
MNRISKTDMYRFALLLLITSPAVNTTGLCKAEEKESKWPASIQAVLDETRPLEFDREGRLPLYLWPARDPGPLDEKTAEELVKKLNERGIGLFTSWDPKNREKTLAESLTIARAQKKLGLLANINANDCIYHFFNGDERTAHIDDQNKPFWDESFGKKHKMGCPFTLGIRKAAIREQFDYFINAFKKEGVNVDFVFTDWEIDGPIEFNNAHAASKQCQRCRENIKNINDFNAFQKSLRKIRCDLQREVYAEPMKANFPNVLVGNYSVYPHNGYRYWYDYYEYYAEGQLYLADQRAKYRKWYQEFPETGYTFAMPVVYTWNPIFSWYDYANTDYRWFYNMLLVASNVGENTPDNVPIISFVHWHTIEPAAETKQLSEEKYQELLWHMLLRGTDTFFLWCMPEEAAKEVQLLHPVYAQAQEYGEFLSKGKPINFRVPKQPGTVISGLKLGDKVLVRRTDFNGSTEPVEITIDTRKIKIEAAPGCCQIISLE